MPRAAQNFIWRKQATWLWLEKNELQLKRATGGVHAVIERPGNTRVMIEQFCATRRAAELLAGEFGGSVVALPPDWETQYFCAHRTKTLRIGKRLAVVDDAEALDAQGARSALIIPAGAAFGTGEHATTAMSLRLLERVSRTFPQDWRMLDAGTGSGILALAAKRFGAGHVVALDYDRTAIATARQNARANKISGIRFAVADVTRGELGSGYNIIAANLYSELLEAVLPRLQRSLRADGRLILSGVLRQQEAQLLRALSANKLRVLEAKRRGKWIAWLVGLRPN